MTKRTYTPKEQNILRGLSNLTNRIDQIEYLRERRNELIQEARSTTLTGQEIADACRITREQVVKINIRNAKRWADSLNAD